jgi:hypothetical protein
VCSCASEDHHAWIPMPSQSGAMSSCFGPYNYLEWFSCALRVCIMMAPLPIHHWHLLRSGRKGINDIRIISGGFHLCYFHSKFRSASLWSMNVKYVWYNFLSYYLSIMIRTELCDFSVLLSRAVPSVPSFWIYMLVPMPNRRPVSFPIASWSPGNKKISFLIY